MPGPVHVKLTIHPDADIVTDFDKSIRLMQSEGKHPGNAA
jgi:hypothetical protein